MATWTYKQWGALIGALVVFSIALVGIGETALVVIFGVIGYFVGKFLDGELNLQDIQQRAQGRDRQGY
ncbi:MAG TPA: DUF2273 domain-containing protein [Armatimonadota bacterium]|jgi:uncharacterized membrane protein|nr:DUF2273 domain-containing protein [Armatimonadota bacterium]